MHIGCIAVQDCSSLVSVMGLHTVVESVCNRNSLNHGGSMHGDIA